MFEQEKLTKITVSAPGSIMLCGEHAVVYGHQAIVCAIEQRIAVSLTPREDKLVRIESELAKYQASLTDLAPHPKLSFVLEAIASAKLDNGIDLEIHSAINPTLGLGSSAAVTSATLGALAQLQHKTFDLPALHRQALAIIHLVQQRGSGADLAASIYGGVIAYQQDPISITPLTTTMPWALALQYSGYKTPTAQVLAMIAEKMHAKPARFQQLYQQMGAVSERAITALGQADNANFHRAIDDYQQLMVELGVSDATLNDMIASAYNQPQTLSSKISGSGLGDCIVTFYDPNHNPPANHTPITVATQGIRLEHSPASA